MALSTLYDSINTTISYDSVNHWLYAEWTGTITDAAVREGCMKIVQLLTELNCHKLLNDNTFASAIDSASCEWAAYTWLPLAQTAGLDFFAWVYSPKLQCREWADRAISYCHSPHVAAFEDVATAYSWLQDGESPCRPVTQSKLLLAC